MNRFRNCCLLIAACFVLIVGCSTVTVDEYSASGAQALCTYQQDGHQVAVYWDVVWRSDQKESEARTALAAREIERFFQQPSCYTAKRISRYVGGQRVALLSDSQLIEQGRQLKADRVIRLVVQELGPNLTLYLSPVLWSTHNRVMLNLKVLDTQSGDVLEERLQDWKRGGAFTFLSAESLGQDLVGALSQAFNGTSENTR